MGGTWGVEGCEGMVCRVQQRKVLPTHPLGDWPHRLAPPPPAQPTCTSAARMTVTSRWLGLMYFCKHGTRRGQGIEASALALCSHVRPPQSKLHLPCSPGPAHPNRGTWRKG